MDELHKFDDIVKQIQEKYTKIDQDTDDHLYGLLYSKPITYWDYIQTDALLNLQIQRTTLPDEMVFIAYHQINELIFKMILWEIKQVSDSPSLEVDFFQDKLMRGKSISRKTPEGGMLPRIGAPRTGNHGNVVSGQRMDLHNASRKPGRT